jgi:hypothetical protein
MQKSELRVMVVADEIIITMPGSTYSVTYYKPKNGRLACGGEGCS